MISRIMFIIAVFVLFNAGAQEKYSQKTLLAIVRNNPQNISVPKAAKSNGNLDSCSCLTSYVADSMSKNISRKEGDAQPVKHDSNWGRQQNADGSIIYRFKLAKRGVMLDSATCYAWIPADVGKIRSVIVHLHGCTREGDASQMVYDVQWKALARKYHSVLLAPAFISGGNAKACVNWYDPNNGSDSVFMAMLDTLSIRTGHSEIKTVPWALWGHSGGSIWTTVMTGKYPQRVAVAVAESCGVDISSNDAALKVPMLYHNGKLDICNNGSSMFADGRKKGALWAHAINPVVESPMDGHQVHNLRFLAIPWMDACLSKRLPKNWGSSKLRKMDSSQEWLGDTSSYAIAPAAFFQGNKLAACWFPDRIIAEKWTEYMVKGTVTDSTPPPAPFDLLGTYADNKITLQWDCYADLESGIKTFVIYRNGKKLKTLVYKTKTKYSDQTGFQRWNDGDQPAPAPAPKMTFVDATIGLRGKFNYQVSCVNWSGVEGAKSKILVFENGIVR